MRKAIILLASLALTGLAYWGYLRLSGSTPLAPPDTTAVRQLQLPQPSDTAQRIGQTVLHEVEQSYYITRDPATRKVTRVFGFSRLNNPGTQSTRWEVEKPYIIFYESAYQCRIDADSGLIQTERSGAAVTPRDGRLEGNVAIHIKPRPGSAMAETTLHLDDLLFSSERTEFSTDGPVRVVSSQVELIGRGLLLLFNVQDGQVEYLHILDLESLRLKDIVRAESPRDASAEDAQQEKPLAAADDDTRRLYQCVIEDNVLIRYGDQLIVAGAEQINIQNIFLARQESSGTSLQPQTDTQTLPAAEMEIPAPPPLEAAAAVAFERDDSRDIVVTCDGGILCKPMEDAPAAAMAIEMSGMPLRIEQIDPHAPHLTTPLAHCGLLQYDTASEHLTLFADAHGDGILLAGGDAGRIRTQGPVSWDRKSNQAILLGPGKVYMDENKDPNAEGGHIAFEGTMELFFAEAPVRQTSLRLAAANLTGGMSAQLGGGRALMTAAENAYLTFGPENSLVSARLEGSVRFENADAQTPAAATSHAATFQFDPNRQLTSATLSGDVRMDSEGRHLSTPEAVIVFAADETGAVQPTHFDTLAEATLETAAATALPPARFEAQSLRYDLLTGSGRAVGPVRFTFFMPADPERGLLNGAIPVEINADGDAEFIAENGRAIETILFKRNVSGVQTLNYAAYTESNAFSADTMIVRLGRGGQGATDIESITLRDGDVFAESKRTHESLKLAHIRLTCQEIVYDRKNERLLAAGPGEIAVDNSKAEPAASSGGLDLRGPAYAKIEGFDRIEWIAAERRIVADGNADTMQLVYLPVVDGVPDIQRRLDAAAGQVDIRLTEPADGQSQLAELTARDRVFFEEKGRYLLEGYTLTYDAENQGWLSIAGTEDRPCVVNGARVPYIHYNLNTRQLETRLSTIPGAVSVP